MDISLSPLMVELYEHFIVLNYKLYEFKYGQTKEGRQRLKLYEKIVGAINELKTKKIADLGSLYANLSIVFPMIPISLLEELAKNLDCLYKEKSINISCYTEILFTISTLIVSCNQHMSRLMSALKMRQGKHSRLDHLDCKERVLEIFKKIVILERTNTAQGRASAFATVFQSELRPLLKDTVYFEEHPDEDVGYEKAYLTNNRAYKSVKKLYETWKKTHSNKLSRVLVFFEDNLWHISGNPFPPAAPSITQRELAYIRDFTRNIDEILSTETKILH